MNFRLVECQRKVPHCSLRQKKPAANISVYLLLPANWESAEGSGLTFPPLVSMWTHLDRWTPGDGRMDRLDRQSPPQHGAASGLGSSSHWLVLSNIFLNRCTFYIKLFFWPNRSSLIVVIRIFTWFFGLLYQFQGEKLRKMPLKNVLTKTS